MNWIRKSAARVGLAVAALGVLAGPQPAQAWWRGGYGYGGGVFFGYAPPPLYFAPPPVYYVPPYYPAPAPIYTAPQAAQGCYAGPYVCPLDAPAAIGGPCSCPANRGRAYGRAG